MATLAICIQVSEIEQMQHLAWSGRAGRDAESAKKTPTVFALTEETKRDRCDAQQVYRARSSRLTIRIGRAATGHVFACRLTTDPRMIPGR